MYVQCDTFLITEKFEEEFRKTYDLHPAHFCLAPDMASMDMHLMIESGIRDGNMSFNSLSRNWKQ